ncbi:DEAD/DEAH box helicase family protein [Patescibacteria group bacterium]|nr:DEAD/DEAH box helicase family protein [Patescibacteria group bacterium]
MHLKPFQITAIENLQNAFHQLWKYGPRSAPLVFKAPTGSGKTIMLAEFLRQLTAEDLHLEADLAFIWISFSPESYEQSKRKLYEYYDDGVAGITLRDMNDMQRGKLKQNEVFFINWSKLNSKAKDNRKIHRSGESNISFEEFIANTKAEGREIILIIDEAHLFKDSDLSSQNIRAIDPKIEIQVSATPHDSHIPSREDEEDHKAAFVRVKHDDVVADELIKEKIEVMPEEEIEKHKKELSSGDKGTEEVLLDLAMAKRAELAEKYKKLGKEINPLALIQIPNFKKEDEIAEKNLFKEVQEYLQDQGVRKDCIAVWLADKSISTDPTLLRDLVKANSHFEYLIFKQAAATGWDCPRASVMVMLRNIKSPTFEKQVLGRILRMPEAKYYSDPALNRAYLYTNFRRKTLEEELAKGDTIGKNRASIYFAKRKIETDLVLPSVHLGRVSYGDLGDSFQQTFIEVANKYFGLTGNEILGQMEKKLKAKNLNLQPDLTDKLIINAEVECYDNFLEEITKSGEDFEYERTYHDIARLYNLVLFKVLKVQEEEKRKFAPERSWPKLKTAINVWLKYYGMDSDDFYKIVFADLVELEHSILTKVIGEALEKYWSIRQREIEIKAEKSKTKIPFSIPEYGDYTDEYEEIPAEKCIMQPAYFPKKGSKLGSEIERKFIINFLEKSSIDWWYKNGDSGTDAFGIEYLHPDGSRRTFYPDFIVQRKTDEIGIYETKDGITAELPETKAKAEALQKYISEYKKLKLTGGIVIESGEQWRINQNKKYEFNKRDLKEWDDLN